MSQEVVLIDTSNGVNVCVAPGTTGNVLTDTGTTWASMAPSGASIALTQKTITSNQVITAGYSAYVAGQFATGAYQIEIGLGSTLEVG